MSRSTTPDFLSPIDGAEFDIRAPRSHAVVFIAAAVIVVMAGLGFFRGVISALPSGVAAALAPTSSVVGAKPAVPMAQNPNWSTLNGPSIQTPAAPKAKPAADDNSDDSSDDDDDSADQAAAPAVSAASAAAPAAAPATAAAKPPAPASAQPAAAEPPPF